MSAPTIEAEGLFSVSYTSTKMGNIATGFNMTLSGPVGSVRNKKTVQVSNGKQSATWGSNSGTVLSAGNRVSRNYEGSSVVVVDPIYDLFQKLVYFSTEPTSFSEKVKGVGNLVVLTVAEVETLLYDKLRKGDIESVINKIIRPPAHISISYNKVAESPIVSALMGNTAFGGITDNTINVALRIFTSGTLMSVGDIFTQFISPLGLELHWDGHGKYSLEPPRLSMTNPKSVKTIKRDEIVDLRITTDPYNAPDIVIPSMALQTSLGRMADNAFVVKSLEAGILPKMGGKNLRVSTYDIPEFLFGPVEAAVKAAEDFGIGSYEGGIPAHTMKEVADDIARFYGSHARKSSLYGQKTGECIMVLRPDITEAYNWYTIDGTLCFVSDIRHELSRATAVTILTIAGVKDPNMNTSGLGGFSPSKLPDSEKKVRQDLHSRAKNETKKIKSDVKTGEKKIEIKTRKMTKKEKNKIFGDAEENQKVVENMPVGSAVNFT